MRQLKSEVRWTQTSDLDDLVANLSVESERGLVVMGLNPVDVLWQGFISSEQLRTLLITNRVAVVAGVVRRDWGGQFWCNISKLVTQHPREFLKGAQRIFEELSDGYKVLMNEVYSENPLTLNLAEHFGFKIVDTRARGVRGELFHLVRWEAP